MSRWHLQLFEFANDLAVVSSHIVWPGGVLVRVSDSRLKGRGFESW